MRTMLAALAVAGGVALICCEGAEAMSASGTVMNEAATAASMLRLAGRGSDRIQPAKSDAETARQTGQQHRRDGSTWQH
jgi:hypothetical protein